MLLLLGVIAAGSLLWHAQSEGLGKGGEILFETALVVGAVWLADSLNLGILGMIVFVGIAGLYLQHRKKKAERLAQAEFRKQVTGLDDKTTSGDNQVAGGELP